MKKIMVVDDNIASLRQIEALLADDFEVSLAKSGETGLKMLSASRFDLILLDVEMPVMDGFEMLAKMRENPLYAGIPVIFLTGNKQLDIKVRCLKEGAADFIVKPAEKSVLLHRISLHISMSDNYRSLEKLVRDMSDSLAITFSELIEFRDEDTGGHVVRTSLYVELLGRELISTGAFSDELTEATLESCVRAAPLHDIGKIAISDSVLLKPGSLTAGEFAVMQTHAQIGADIIDGMLQLTPSLYYLQYAREIAATHHERYDGSGYPNGLLGSAIPLCGRLMAVADVYDALVNDRVYRKGLSKELAREIIFDGSGKSFDPAVVEAFRHICAKL
ncbi:MAG: response regulator [Oscillospiraceae bacterium]|nr:response regulator [Oscillospiraceae bacterium]